MIPPCSAWLLGGISYVKHAADIDLTDFLLALLLDYWHDHGVHR
jgi:hypothetical protein